MRWSNKKDGLGNRFYELKYLGGKTKMGIIYKSGYKYQLCEQYKVSISILPLSDIVTEYINLYRDGTLIIKNGYAWDGPSGPTVDTRSFMRGSLVHDALYQLMREGFLDHKTYRDRADLELKKICLEDGMGWLRAEYVYRAVKAVANVYADPAYDKIKREAP